MSLVVYGGGGMGRRSSLRALAGHWIQSGTWANRDSTWYNGLSTFTKAQFECVIFRYHWGEVETGSGSGITSGSFDWTAMDDSAGAAEADGKPFKFVLNWRHFDTSKGNICPPDLVTDYQYTKSGGYASTMYVSTVRERFEKWAKAVIDRYSTSYTYFSGIQTTETAGMDSITGGVTYNQSTYETQLNTLFKNLAAHNKNVWIDIGWNFINGAFNTADSVTAYNNILSGVPTNNVKLFTPDILRADSDNDNEFSSLNSRVYPLFDSGYNGTTCDVQNYTRGSSMQFTSYTLPGAADTKNNGGYDMDQLFTWGRDNLGLSFVIWTYQNARNYNFDTPRTGQTYGDAVGVARLDFDHAYNDDYAVAA